MDTPQGLVVPVIRDAVSNDGKTSAWRYVLPLSLSWDHRVIDGAAAARFNSHFGALLADMRRMFV